MVADSEKPFEGILGKSSELKVLEHLMACQKLNFNITELSRMVGVTRNVITPIIARFLKWNMVSVEKEMGRIKLYSLNEQSGLVKSMFAFSNEVINQLIEMEQLGTQTVLDISKEGNETNPNEFNIMDVDYENIVTANAEIDWLAQKPKSRPNVPVPAKA